MLPLMSYKQNSFLSTCKKLEYEYLVDGTPEKPDFLSVERCSFGTDETKTARPDPEIDFLSFADVPQHLALTAVPGQGEVDEVAHGHAEVDAVEEPDEVAGLWQHDAEDGGEGHDHVYRVDP